MAIDLEGLLNGRISAEDCNTETIDGLLRIIRIQQLMLSGAYSSVKSDEGYLTTTEIHSLLGAHSCNLYPFYLIWDEEIGGDGGFWSAYQSTDVLIEFLDLSIDGLDYEPSHWRPISTPHDFLDRIKCANENENHEGVNMQHLLNKPDNWLMLRSKNDDSLHYQCFYFDKKIDSLQ